MSSHPQACPGCSFPNNASALRCQSCGVNTHPSETEAFVSAQASAPSDGYSYPHQAPYPVSYDSSPPPTYETALPSPHTLPYGWEMRTDELNRTYYVNHIHHVTQWEYPSELPSAPSSSSYVPPMLPGSVVAAPPYTAPAPYSSQAPTQYSSPTPASYSSSPAPYNSSFLNDAQLHEVPPKQVDQNHIARKFGLCSAFSHTITHNKLLCAICVGLWIMIPNLVIALIHNSHYHHHHDEHVQKDPVFFIVGTVLLGFLYMVFFIIPAGFICMCMCPSAKSGRYVHDKALESLQAPAAADMTAVSSYLAELQQSPPVITLKLECWHNRNGLHHHRHRRGRSNAEKIVTYTEQTDVPLMRWKDISIDGGDFVNALICRGAANMSLSYEASYEVHPSQSHVIEEFKKNYENANRWRDHHVNVSVIYATPAYQKNRVDNIDNHQVGRSCCAKLVLNYVAFYFCLWTTLYPLYLTLFKVFTTPVRYQSVKYVHVNPDVSFVNHTAPSIEAAVGSAVSAIVNRYI